MRRRQQDRDGIPPHLAVFDPADWPGTSWEPRWREWRGARRAWHDEHGWPGGPLALMREESDTRRGHEGRPLLSWGRTRQETFELDGIRYDPRRLV